MDPVVIKRRLDPVTAHVSHPRPARPYMEGHLPTVMLGNRPTLESVLVHRLILRNGVVRPWFDPALLVVEFHFPGVSSQLERPVSCAIAGVDEPPDRKIALAPVLRVDIIGFELVGLKADVTHAAPPPSSVITPALNKE